MLYAAKSKCMQGLLYTNARKLFNTELNVVSAIGSKQELGRSARGL